AELSWSAYFADAREPERVYAARRASALVPRLPEGRALTLYRAAPENSLARAVLGGRAAVEARAQGQPEGDILRESERLRERLGLSHGSREPRFFSARTDPQRVGCLLPLSGPYKAQGRRALRGAALAAEVPQAGPLTLSVRDASGDRARIE